MKKINQRGFVLAETLVVAVFLMAIFTLIFTNFYPLIGEYEKRESYDDVDGKYAVYWLKRMIEDSSYQITGKKADFFNNKGYIRFECTDITIDNEKQEMCIKMVKALEVKGCNSKGEHCEVYITRYRIGKDTSLAGGPSDKYFKDKIKEKIQRSDVNNTGYNDYMAQCKGSSEDPKVSEQCDREAKKNEFRSGFKDYVESLPSYTHASLDGSDYRVIACFQHKKDNNNYYSYATMEVSR